MWIVNNNNNEKKRRVFNENKWHQVEQAHEYEWQLTEARRTEEGRTEWGEKR